jgi:hypothetical protein
VQSTAQPTTQPTAQSISCQEQRWLRIRRGALAGALPAALVVTIALASDARVPYVPTPQGVVDRMLEMAKVGPADYLVDLGSGDGRIVVTAAKKHGARGFGVDLNPDRIKEANDNARRAGVTDKVSFQQRNLFDADLSLATVITMYLLPRVNLELRPKLLALAPGTRIVSHDFDMGDWKADAETTMRDESKFGGAGGESDIYLWIVPEKAAGTWRWQTKIAGKPQSYEIRLEQKYQVITGSVWLAGRTATLREAKLRGAEISFNFTMDVNGTLIRQAYNGRIEGDSIVGTAEISGPRIQAQVEWDASRGARSASSPHSLTHKTAFN